MSAWDRECEMNEIITIDWESLQEAIPVWCSIIGYFATADEAQHVAEYKDFACKKPYVLYIPDAPGDKYAAAYNPVNIE